MRLIFGALKLDTAGLPAVSALHVAPPVSERRPVLVHIKLDTPERAAVQRWADRLGVEVTEQLRPLYVGDAQPLEFAAVAEADGYHVTVYTRAAAEAPAPAGGASC